MKFSEEDLFGQGPVICFTWQLSPGWPVLQVTNNIRQFGYESKDFLSKELLFAEILHPDDLDRIANEVIKFIEDGVVQFEQDYRIITKSGKVRWVYDKTILKKDVTGLPTHAKGHLLDITERKLAEQQLNESWEQYYHLFESNKAVELLIDPGSRRIIKANRAAEQFYGYNKAEFDRLLISDINTLPPEIIKQEIAMALAEERDYFNFRHRLKSGEIRDVSVYSGPLTFGNRKLLYSIVHDITDQRQAEHALLKSEQKFRSFIESTSEGFLILDKQLNITFANHALCQLTGYELVELRGRSALHYTGSEFRQSFGTKLNLLHIQSHKSTDLIISHKNGQELIVRFKATAMEDGTGIFAFITDITARRKNEIQLKKLSSAVKQSASSIMITDKNGIIEYVNPKFREVTGYRKSEIIGQTPNILSTNETPAERYRDLWNTILTGKDWHGETFNRTKSGAFYWSLMSISPIMDDDGEISHFISVSEDISEQKSQQLKMEKLALYDPLTGMANRRLLYDRLNQAIEIIRRQQHAGIGVMVLDLDRFKIINDSYGHDVGDALLKEISSRLTECVRKEDTISRPGGDEFTILLQEISHPEDIQPVAQKILQSLRRTVRIDTYSFQITCSIGISIAPLDSVDSDTLLKYADLALYRAKQCGRNNFQFFTASMQDKIQNKLIFKSEMIQALQDDHFVLHYLPLLDLDQLQIHGIEALIRYQHPSKGLLAPNDFLEEAETLQLHTQLGDWVLRRAAGTLQRLHNQGLEAINLSVNISPGQFSAPSFVSSIYSVIKQFSINPCRLHLEISEATLLDDIQYSKATLGELDKMGFAITIDDFGTELSSLRLLQQLKIGTVKLHRNFISRILEDQQIQQLTKAMIAMARELNIEVIAVGIETEEQANLLTQQGCRLGQGFHYYQPLSEQMLFEKMLSTADTA